MSYLVRSLDEEIEKSSLLKHTFYKMWSDGELTREHLAGYAEEYFQLVKAVPDLVGTIGGFVADAPTRSVIAGIKEEETQHVELWAKFACAMGVPREALVSYHGTPKTQIALSNLRDLAQTSFYHGAAAMYAIESEQPKISRTKLNGLKAFYGMSGDEDGTTYFREHEVADVRHAAVWRGLIERQRVESDDAATVGAAALSLKVQNAILDAVMETYVKPAPR